MTCRPMPPNGSTLVPSQECHGLGQSLYHMGLWGTYHIQTVASGQGISIRGHLCEGVHHSVFHSQVHQMSFPGEVS